MSRAAVSPMPLSSDKWLSRFRSVLVAVLGTVVACIGTLAFFTSFEAIKQYAVHSGGIDPNHAWAVPLLVDSFIAVATGADLWFSTTARQRHWWELWWPKLLLAGAATVSFMLNVAHAEPTLAARGVAAIPPAALVLSVELLMMVLRRATALRAARLEEAQAKAREAELAAEPASSKRKGRKSTELAPVRPAATPSTAKQAPAAAVTGEVREPAAPTAPDGDGARKRKGKPVVVTADETAARPVPGSAVPATTGSQGRKAAGETILSGAPRNGAAAPAPPRVVAARILDGREREGEPITPEALAEAMAREGVVMNVEGARALLHELRPVTVGGRREELFPQDGQVEARRPRRLRT